LGVAAHACGHARQHRQAFAPLQWRLAAAGVTSFASQLVRRIPLIGMFTGPVEFDAKRRAEVAQGQKPFTIVVSCSDSRVGPEVVFDQGLGDLFVVRSAGHVVDEVGLGARYDLDTGRVEVIEPLSSVNPRRPTTRVRPDRSQIETTMMIQEARHQRTSEMRGVASRRAGAGVGARG